jgi:hypothetical protein
MSQQEHTSGLGPSPADLELAGLTAAQVQAVAGSRVRDRPAGEIKGRPIGLAQ